MEKSCLYCGKTFSKPYTCGLPEWGERKFCSHKCHNESQHIERECLYCGSKWLGRKKDYCSRQCAGKAKGYKIGHPAPKTAFQKQDLRITGSINKLWKGDEVGYGALHSWLRRKLGKATYCVNSPTHKGIFNWANISGEYKRDISDWHQLCNSCNQKDGIKISKRFTI